MTRTARILAAGATPITPSARPGPLPCPAISEAMKVPCQRGGRYRGGLAPLVKSGPVVTEPLRSGTAGSVPVSSTPTVTPRPLVTRQAAGTPIATRSARSVALACWPEIPAAGVILATVPAAARAVPAAESARMTADTSRVTAGRPAMRTAPLRPTRSMLPVPDEPPAPLPGAPPTPVPEAPPAPGGPAAPDPEAPPGPGGP